MKKSLIKDRTISFQEKTSAGMVNKSFDCPKEHVEMHLKAMKALCYNVKVQQRCN